MNIEKLDNILAEEPAYRRTQIKQSIFGRLIQSWDDATNLPAGLRSILIRECPLEINHRLTGSPDRQSMKALIHLSDGASVETVLMRHKGRNTVCVSSQVGCALGCSFCATGGLGFTRNLSSAEIVEQVLLFSRLLGDQGEKVTNIVYMGMGEPFLNYDNVLESIRFMNDKDTFHFGARRFSISTAGIIEGIDRFAKEQLEVNLAISLHACDDRLREQLMPINKKYPISALISSAKSYVRATNRKLFFEYTLIKGVNDSEVDAERLADMLTGLLCLVNIIPFNPAPGGKGSPANGRGGSIAAQRFRASNGEAIRRFKEVLDNRGIAYVQRYRYGDQIFGACGQLAGASSLSGPKGL